MLPRAFLLLPLLGLLPSGASGQIIDFPDDAVAGIPVNYTEAKAGWFDLPDPLVCADGSPVTDLETWRAKRRPEIFRMIEAFQYGRVPARPESMTFDVFDPGTAAFEGRAVRKQVTIAFDAEKKRTLDLLLYLPADAPGPVPVLINIGWVANNLAVQDPGVKPGRRWNPQSRSYETATESRSMFRLQAIPQLIARGYGIAHFNYNDIEPDHLDGFSSGIRSHYLEAGQSAPADDQWGAIAAWGWGISRVIDYLETDPDVDGQRIAITGVSRLGKTALWAGARDERVACVIASVSGSGGASLNRRNYGERPAHLLAPTRYPYWFAPGFAAWVGREHEAPWDSHMILALIAPRPVLLQTGSTDRWSDPYGELVAARAATPVYHLFGLKGIESYPQPPAGVPSLHALGYLMHDGGHGTVPADWPVFLDFMDQHLRGNAGSPSAPARQN
jgi:hypothetical protein